jgi:hypothetical protein
VSLIGVIGAFATPGPYTVTRTTNAGYGSTGRLVAGVPSTFQIVAVVRPTTARQIQLLPEGYHGVETKAVYTLTALVSISPTNQPDSIAIDGENWKAISAKKVDAFDGEFYYVAIVSREVLSS